MRNARLPAALVVLCAAIPAQQESTSPIAWHGTWKAGLAAAAAAGRPILLVAAAPHCHEVPGIW